MNADAPELSIVVLSWNTRDLLRACLRSLHEVDHELRLEVIVVDNASADDSAELVGDEFPAVRLERNDENRGYAGGNNQGLEMSTAPFVMLLNSDTEVRPGALERLVEFLREHPEHGAVAPRLSNPDGSVQRACMRFPGLKVGFLYDSIWDRIRDRRTGAVRRYFMEDFDHLESRDVDQPPGAAFVLRREVVDEVGIFDESLWLFFNDVDLCRRIVRAGWRIHYLAEAEVLHHGGSSTSKFPDFVKTWNVNRVRYYRKHHGWFGAAVVKLAICLRAAEETLKILWRAPRGERKLGVQNIFQVLGAALRA